MHDSLAQLEALWPSTIVARSEVGRFSGGLLNPRTIANRDSQGTGPRNRLKLGKSVGYSVHDLLEWMDKNLTKASNSGGQ